MNSGVFKVGELFHFSYLWHRQAQGGEEIGRKHRPVCLVFRLASEPELLLIYPLTTQQPPADRLSVEVPEQERRRNGLDSRCWLILDELNAVHISATYDFASLVPLGRFSAGFVAEIQELAKSAIRSRRLKQVRRT
jgi:hypothetical protein